MKIIATFVLCTISLSTTVASGQSQYKNLMNQQGYTVMKTPRTAFGTGTIIGKLGNLKDEPLATPEQCFPGLEQSITTSKITLSNSHQEKNLGLKGGASYVPGGTNILGSIIGAFNFNRIRNLDVTFGPTVAADWTAVAFENYLDGKEISAPCFKRLRDRNSKVILSTALVESLTYTLNGDVKAGSEVNAEALEKTVTANFGATYSNLTRTSFSVAQPMYIAYKAVSFRDLGLDRNEASDEPVRLEKGKFKLEAIN
jgi:hypothetical protein